MKRRGSSSASTSDRIIQSAVAVLRDSGYHGMSMRAVASEAGVSLSNVQYYYRDKDALVCALVERYMKRCEDDLRELVAQLSDSSIEERRARLLTDALRHGHVLTEICLVFREIWALSSRNARVSTIVGRYYAAYAELIADCLLPDDADADARRRLSLLLVPYIEGYSVAGSGLRDDAGDAVSLMCELIAAL